MFGVKIRIKDLYELRKKGYHIIENEECTQVIVVKDKTQIASITISQEDDFMNLVMEKEYKKIEEIEIIFLEGKIAFKLRRYKEKNQYILSGKDYLPIE